MVGALDGIRVLDFTSVVSGPFCTRLLADCGAEVVKVEPAGGDRLRLTPPIKDGQSRYFAAYNCGKKSVVLDLKNGEDVQIARRLARVCDVLVENYRPGVMDRFGLGYETLKEQNPGLVYASLSGFGQDGPMANFPAYGPVVQASSGFEAACLQYQQGERAMTPPVIGVQIADVVSGTFTFGAIQTALLNRERWGNGDRIDVTLMESIMAVITGELQVAQSHGDMVGGFTPIRASDDFIMVAPISPGAVKGVYRLLDRPGEDKGVPTTREELEALLEGLADWAAERDADECQKLLVENNVPCSKYRTPRDVLEDNHLRDRESFTELRDSGGAFKINNAPFRFLQSSREIRGGAPKLNEHKQEIMKTWLGRE